MPPQVMQRVLDMKSLKCVGGVGDTGWKAVMETDQTEPNRRENAYGSKFGFKQNYPDPGT